MPAMPFYVALLWLTQLVAVQGHHWVLGDENSVHCYTLKGTPEPSTIETPPGLLFKWTDPIPEEGIHEGDVNEIGFQVTLPDADFFWNNLATGGNNTKFREICDKPCPSESSLVGSATCCMFHVNMHSCRTPSACEPWVKPANSTEFGTLVTHTASTWGTWGEFRQNLSLPEGTWNIIAHIKIMNFQCAIGAPRSVLAPRSGMNLAVMLPIIGGILVLVIVVGVWFYFKHTAQSRKMKNALKAANLAECTADAIATLDFEGETIQLLKSVQEPNALQCAFLRIVDIIVEYKAYLPPGFGMEDDDDKSDLDSDEEEAMSKHSETPREPGTSPRADKLSAWNKGGLQPPKSARSHRSAYSSQKLSARRGSKMSAHSKMSGPRRRMSVMSKMSGGNRSVMAPAKAAQVAVGMKHKACTIMVVQVLNWRTVVDTLDSNVVPVHASVLEIISMASKKENGILEDFNQGTFVVSWGANANCTDQGAKAVTSALEIQQQLTSNEDLAPYGLDIVFGIESGKAMVGNMGSKTMRRSAIVGKPIETAYWLTSLAPHFETTNNIFLGPLCRNKLSPLFKVRFLDFMATAPGAPIMGTFNVLEVNKVEAEDEWMYQLETANGDDGGLSSYNQAWLALEQTELAAITGQDSHSERLRTAIGIAKSKGAKKYYRLLRSQFHCPVMETTTVQDF